MFVNFQAVVAAQTHADGLCQLQMFEEIVCVSDLVYLVGSQVPDIGFLPKTPILKKLLGSNFESGFDPTIHYSSLMVVVVALFRRESAANHSVKHSSYLQINELQF